MSYRHLGQILAPAPAGPGPTLSPTLTMTPKASSTPPTVTSAPTKVSTPAPVYAPLSVQPATTMSMTAPVVAGSPIPSNVSPNIRFILESALKYKPTAPGQFVAMVITGAIKRLPLEYQQKLRTPMAAAALRAGLSKDIKVMAQELTTLAADSKVDYYLRLEANVLVKALAAAPPPPPPAPTSVLKLPTISLSPAKPTTAPTAPSTPKLALPSFTPAPMPTPDPSFQPPTTSSPTVYPETPAPEQVWAPQPGYMPGDGIAPMDSATSSLPSIDTSLSPADYFALPPDSGLLPPEAAPAISIPSTTTEEPWHKKVPIWAWVGGGAVVVGGIVFVATRHKKPVTPNRRRRR